MFSTGFSAPMYQIRTPTLIDQVTTIGKYIVLTDTVNVPKLILKALAMVSDELEVES